MRTFPDRMITTLQFFESSPINTGGIGFASTRYVATGPLKPSFVSPLPATGFTEFAAVYATYRVLRSRIVLQVTPQNPQALPVNVVIFPGNADPTASVPGATIVSWFTQPYSIKGLCGGFGAPPLTLKHSMTTAKMYGSEAVNTDDNFGALTTLLPVNNWFWGIGLYTLNVPDELALYAVSVYIEHDVQFYDRRRLS